MDRLAQYGIAVDSWSSADFCRQQAEAGGGVGGDAPPAAAGSPTARGQGVPSNGAAPARADGALPVSNGAGPPDGADWLPWGLGRLLAGGGSGGGGGEGGPQGGALSSGAALAGASASANGSSSGSSDEPLYAPAAASSSAAAAAAAASGRGGRLDAQALGRRINWLNSIRAWQAEFLGTLRCVWGVGWGGGGCCYRGVHHAPGPRCADRVLTLCKHSPHSATEFVACVTDDLLGQGVFVFTPLGQVGGWVWWNF